MPSVLARKSEGHVKTCSECGCTFLYSDNEVTVEIITRKDFHGKEKTDKSWYIDCPDCRRHCYVCPPFNAVKKSFIDSFKEMEEAKGEKC